MFIAKLEGAGLRNLQPFALQLTLLNVLSGDNGSGKTSALEALHVLATGRSFRSKRIDGAISHAENTLTLFAMGCEPDAGLTHRYGYRKTRGGEVDIRVDGTAASLSEMAAALPVRFIGPGSEELLEGEPAARRAFLDWILFHVEPGYLQLWRRANRALAQRNALLKQRAASATLRPWTVELAEASAQIAALRSAALTDLEAELSPLLPAFSFMEEIGLMYVRSPMPETAEAWLALELRERELGYSLCGYQRDDLRIRVPEGAARDLLSRGQKKVLVYALLLAEAALVRRKTGKISVLLLDDLCSELDQRNAAEVLRLVLATGMQAFITALSPDELDGLLPAAAGRSMFHVEHGDIRPLD